MSTQKHKIWNKRANYGRKEKTRLNRGRVSKEDRKIIGMFYGD